MHDVRNRYKPEAMDLDEWEEAPDGGNASPDQVVGSVQIMNSAPSILGSDFRVHQPRRTLAYNNSTTSTNEAQTIS